MKIAIIARRKSCARVLEILSNTSNTKMEHTDSKMFGTDDLAVFTLEGTDEDIIFAEKMIKGEFSSYDVLSYRFVTGRYPMIE